jgi:RNA polymerase sigma factor (sigma-70 family)
VGGDTGLAEDLVQDTWMRAIVDWRSKGIPVEPIAWLIRVARNTLISYVRRVRPQLIDAALLDRIEAEPAVAAEDPGAAAVINWGLSRLRRSHAQLLEDFYFTGKSVRDMARERSLSERAFEQRWCSRSSDTRWPRRGCGTCSSGYRSVSSRRNP